MLRYFVHFAEHTPHDFIDRAETHGRVVEVRMHTDPLGGMVYGSAEIDPRAQGDQNEHEDR